MAPILDVVVSKQLEEKFGLNTINFLDINELRKIREILGQEKKHFSSSNTLNTTPDQEMRDFITNEDLNELQELQELQKLINIIEKIESKSESENSLLKKLESSLLKNKISVQHKLLKKLNDSNFKHKIKSIVCNNSKNNFTEELLSTLSLYSATPMIIFLDALYNRDFTTMKALLPYLFMAESILSDYEAVLIRENELTPQSSYRIRNANICIEQCQKDIVNIETYTGKDVLLLIILAILKPTAKKLSMLYDNHFINSSLDFKSTTHAQFELSNDLKLEIDYAEKTLLQLKNLYNLNRDTLYKNLKIPDLILKDKESMEFQNFVYNIINVFAWLPLLLLNIKRLYNGESMRLFHYVEFTYSENFSKSVIDLMYQTSPS